jgi:DNA-directed RNA polymerase subunit RPC12/RpoP
VERKDRSPSRKLTPTGSNTSASVKCTQCGAMYPAGNETGETGTSGCMVCPNCGFENCADDSTIVNASDEEY